MKTQLTYSEFVKRLRNDTLETPNGNCPAEPILRLFQGKWKNEVLYCLCMYPTVRFGQLKKLLGGITNTMLTATLRDLEKEGFISRKQFNEIPPHVEYSFTQKGLDLMPVFYEMTKWSYKYADEKTK